MFVPENIENYCQIYSTAPNQLLQNLERETHIKTQQPHMLSGHLQGRFLSTISKLVQPKCILEIGTFTGYSALCLAEGLAENGILHTIDCNNEMESICTKYFSHSQYAEQIKLHIGNAVEIIPTLNLQPNVVFIDADKTNYITYFDLIINSLASGGIIIADNVLFHGEVLNENKSKNAKAIHAFNEYIQQQKTVTKTMLPIRDGLLLMQKI